MHKFAKAPARALRRGNRMHRGFTLIEIIVVVAIIALLAAIIVPVVASQIQKAKETSQRADLKEIGAAFTRFYIDTQLWPDAVAGKAWDPGAAAPVTVNPTDLVTNGLWVRPTELNPVGGLPPSLNEWKGPYLNTNDRVFGAGGVVDRWGQPYRIALFPRAAPAAANVGGSIVIWSKGPNQNDDSGAVITAAANGACPPAGASDDICYVVTQAVK